MNPPTVCVEACYSKHRRTDVLPLEASLVECLEGYLHRRVQDRDCGGPPTNRLWPGKWYVALFLAALGNLAVALSILNCGYSAAVFYFDPEARSAWLLIGLLVPILVLLMYPAVQTA